MLVLGGGEEEPSAPKKTSGGGDYVFRGLDLGEDPSKGLVARNPNAPTTPGQHIAGARRSPWISTTRSEEIAKTRYGQFGVVRIDLSKLNTIIVDCTRGVPEDGYTPTGQMSRRGIRDQEVLIHKYVPPEAIKPVD